MEFATERIAERMDRSSVDRTEDETSVKRAEGKRLAGFDIVAVFDSAEQIGCNESDALKRVDVGRRVCEFICIGFDAVD